jgi:non-heme chloroperoxidase
MHRRDLLHAGAAVGAGLAAQAAPRAEAAPAARRVSRIETADGVELFYRVWGEGPRTLVFVAAWGFSSESWQYQMQALAGQGFRCVAFDRRSHGRSSDPGRGYEMDTLADDLAAVMDALDLKADALIGHSLGAAEAVRYLTRHGSSRVGRLVLVAPTTPCMLKRPDNPDGLDPQASEAARAAFAADFPGILAANMRPFVIPSTSQAMIDWIVSIMTHASLHALIECNRVLNEADFRPELPRITTPTLVLQGDADVSAPLALTGRRTAALIPGARLEVIEGAPHGLIYTHMQRVNAAIADFARG